MCVIHIYIYIYIYIHTYIHTDSPGPFSGSASHPSLRAPTMGPAHWDPMHAAKRWARSFAGETAKF